MIEFWNSVSEPQATIIAAAMTIVAALSGVLLGSWLFGERVKDLRGALDIAGRDLNGYKMHFESSLKELRDTIEVNVQSIQQSLGNIGTSVNDIQASSVPEDAPLPELDKRAGLREQWNIIRDHLEELAASPEVDGRTRAKYTRIDRRRYSEFISALSNDGRLGVNAGKYFEAQEIWQRYRNGRVTPSDDDINRMTSLARQLVPPATA